MIVARSLGLHPLPVTTFTQILDPRPQNSYQFLIATCIVIWRGQGSDMGQGEVVGEDLGKPAHVNKRGILGIQDSRHSGVLAGTFLKINGILH